MVLLQNVGHFRDDIFKYDTNLNCFISIYILLKFVSKFLSSDDKPVLV